MKAKLLYFSLMTLLCFSLSCTSESEYAEESEYEYSVSGTDEYGNDVEGDIEVNQDGGTGTITDEYGNENEVDVDWTGNGELEATDEDGETYELEVE